MATKRIGKARLPDNVEPTDLLRVVSSVKPPQRMLGEDEWNFETCPKTHLPYCAIYEFARSSSVQCAEIERWRRTDFAGFDAPLDRTTDFNLYWRLNFFRLFPEFPGTPWLRLVKIARTDVDQRIRTIRKIRPIHFRTVPSESLLSDGTLHQQMETFGFGVHGTVQAIEVNWLANDKQLLAAFADWLRQNRRIREHQERGRTSPAERLKALAAKRLLDQHSFEEAAEIADKALGKLLYPNQSKWLDARKRVNDELAGPVSPLSRLLKKTEEIKGVPETELHQLIQWWLTRATAADQRKFLRLNPDKLPEAIQKIAENQAGQKK